MKNNSEIDPRLLETSNEFKKMLEDTIKDGIIKKFFKKLFNQK